MNQVATQPKPSTSLSLHEDINSRTEQFRAALPAHIPVERFKRVLLTALSNNPTLVHADRRTLFNSMMKAAQDGLLPNGIEGALVIYKTKIKDGNGGEQWVDAVQWMPMVAGIRKKVRNSGEISTWEVHAVYSKDEFDYMLGDEPRIHHKPALGGDRGDLIAAYSIATLKTGEKSREIMSAQEIRHVWRTSSKNKDKQNNPTGPWKDHEAEMFRKTVARRHSKVLPMSTDLDDLMRRDDALYDMRPSKDNNVTLPPAEAPRPLLSDFNTKPPVETRAGHDEPAPAPDEQITEDGEVVPYGAADAYSDGQAAFAAGRAKSDIPPNITAFPNLIEAWESGYDSGAEE